MKCPNPQCAKENAKDNKFCPHCGVPLHSDLKAIVREVIAVELKDREVVEVTTAHAIAERVMGWAKLFATLAGVVLTILILAVGLLGYTNVNDLKRTASTAKEQVTNLVSQVTNQLAEVTRQINELETNVSQQRTNLEAAAALPARVVGFTNTLNGLQKELTSVREGMTSIQALQDRVREIEESSEGASISSNVTSRFMAYLRPYDDYLKEIGFSKSYGPIEFRKTTLKLYESVIFSSPEAPERIIVGAQLLSREDFIVEPDALRLTYTRLALHRRDASSTVGVVAEALQHYYPASLIDNANPFPVSGKILPEQWGISMVGTNTFTRVLTASSSIEQLCWEFRARAGKSKTDKWLREAWDDFQDSIVQGGPPPGPNDFVRCVHSRLQTDTRELAEEFRRMAKLRNFNL